MAAGISSAECPWRGSLCRLRSKDRKRPRAIAQRIGREDYSYRHASRCHALCAHQVLRIFRRRDLDKDRALLRNGRYCWTKVRLRGIAMSTRHLKIRELTAWGFDHPVDRGLLAEEQLRNAAFHAHRRVAARSPYPTDCPLSVEETVELASVLAARRDAVASSGEFDGLDWELSIVDLRKLIAFQRRIRFGHSDSRPIHRGARTQQLIDLALPLHPLSRCPYMEVASYRGQWFLRDGYHRSFKLLKQGVWRVPCVVVYAETSAPLGAVGRRVFSPVSL